MNDLFLAPPTSPSTLWSRSLLTAHWQDLGELNVRLRRTVKDLNITEVDAETVLLAALEHVNASQHRHALEFRHLRQIRRLLARLNSIDVATCVRSCLIALFPDTTASVASLRASETPGPSQAAFVFALTRTLTAAALARNLESRCRATATEFSLGIVAVTFLPFRVVVLGALSRLAIVLAVFAKRLSALYDDLRPWCDLAPAPLSLTAMKPDASQMIDHGLPLTASSYLATVEAYDDAPPPEQPPSQSSESTMATAALLASTTAHSVAAVESDEDDMESSRRPPPTEPLSATASVDFFALLPAGKSTRPSSAKSSADVSPLKKKEQRKRKRVDDSASVDARPPKLMQQQLQQQQQQKKKKKKKDREKKETTSTSLSALDSIFAAL